MAILYSLTWCKKKNIYLYSILPQNSEPHSNDEKKKKIRQTQTGEHYTGYLASTSQDYQSNKKQERLRDCHRPEKTREMWQLSEMQYSELGPGKERKH